MVTRFVNPEMKSIALLCSCLVLWLAALSHAQEPCGSEIKVLLRVSEIESAQKAFNAAKGVPGEVYLFDTAARELLSEGVVLRVRRGATNDLMVKVRIPPEKKINVPHTAEDQYKCEVDVTAEKAVRSYSILTSFTVAPPSSGTEFFARLTPAQKQLLQQARVSIDWRQVKRVADIESTSWQIKNQYPFAKLGLEVWKWPAGEILELSTKSTEEAAPSTRKQLEQLVKSKGLGLNQTQELKTSLVLHDIRRSTSP